MISPYWAAATCVQSFSTASRAVCPARLAAACSLRSAAASAAGHERKAGGRNHGGAARRRPTPQHASANDDRHHASAPSPTPTGTHRSNPSFRRSTQHFRSTSPSGRINHDLHPRALATIFETPAHNRLTKPALSPAPRAGHHCCSLALDTDPGAGSSHRLHEPVTIAASPSPSPSAPRPSAVTGSTSWSLLRRATAYILVGVEPSVPGSMSRSPLRRFVVGEVHAGWLVCHRLHEPVTIAASRPSWSRLGGCGRRHQLHEPVTIAARRGFRTSSNGVLVTGSTSRSPLRRSASRPSSATPSAAVTGFTSRSPLRQVCVDRGEFVAELDPSPVPRAGHHCGRRGFE